MVVRWNKYHAVWRGSPDRPSVDLPPYCCVISCCVRVSECSLAHTTPESCQSGQRRPNVESSSLQFSVSLTACRQCYFKPATVSSALSGPTAPSHNVHCFKSSHNVHRGAPSLTTRSQPLVTLHGRLSSGIRRRWFGRDGSEGRGTTTATFVATSWPSLRSPCGG